MKKLKANTKNNIQDFKGFYLRNKKRFWFAISICFVVALIFLILPSSADTKTKNKSINSQIPYLQDSCMWAKEQLQLMSPEEKAAQLIWIKINLNESASISSSINLLKEFKAGGVVFSSGSPYHLRSFIKELQANSKIACFTAAHAEFGMQETLDSIYSLPSYESLWCIQEESTLKMLIENSINQLTLCGINVNLNAPNLSDVYQTMDFAKDYSYLHFVKNVEKIGLEYINRFQKEKIICATEFTPLEKKKNTADKMNLFFDSLSMMPFRHFCDSGLAGIFLSPECINENIKLNSMNDIRDYQGLIIADNSENYNQKQAENYLKNGCNSLIVPTNKDIVSALIQTILDQLSEEELNNRVYRILAAKNWMETEVAQISSRSLYDSLGKKQDLLSHKMVQASISLLRNNNCIPITNNYSSKISCVHIGNNHRSFTYYLSQYSSINSSFLNPIKSIKDANKLSQEFEKNDYVIIAITPEKDKIGENELAFLDSLEKKTKLIICLFGESSHLKDLESFSTLIFCHNNHEVTQKIVAQCIFGGFAVNTNLFKTVSQDYCYLDGKPISKATRIGYTIAEDVGINGSHLYKIDSIAKSAIKNKAFPGCQILFARQGKIFYQESFGYHTYDKKQKVKNSDIYDLASVTKIAATTISLMKLYDEKRFDPDSLLGLYLEDMENSTLQNLYCKEILIHKSGLPPALPIVKYVSKRFLKTDLQNIEEKNEDFDAEEYIDSLELININLKADSLFGLFYSKEKKEDYETKIADNFYFRTDLLDSIWEDVKEKVIINEDKNYVYSDLNFYLLKRIVEEISGEELNKYTNKHFYQSMGLKTMGFLPLKRFDKKRIVPTEKERFFRRQLILGYVHDPTAALMGGVGGHAGLFSNAEDLAILMQMLLNGGKYGTIQYINNKTIKKFTSKQENTSRGLGFNRKASAGSSLIAPSASASTFGHSGFTGVCVWADPETEIIYVFLSNRVHPKSSNQKINQQKIRAKIHQIVYDAIL